MVQRVVGPVTTPKRIQLRRTKGWRKPDGAVIVAPPSKWGNPFRVNESQMRFPRQGGVEEWEYEGRLYKTSGERVAFVHSDNRVTWHEVRDATLDECIEMYREWITGRSRLLDWQTHSKVKQVRAELAGRDLAWCPLDQSCHADVLLAVANVGRS